MEAVSGTVGSIVFEEGGAEGDDGETGDDDNDDDAGGGDVGHWILIGYAWMYGRCIRSICGM